MIYEYGEPQWNDSDGTTKELKRETCSSATLSITNPTWTDLGVNPGLHSERQVTDCLSRGMASALVDFMKMKHDFFA
jgi:hypothetical protein